VVRGAYSDHVIQNPAIHEEVAFWLDHLPAGGRLLLATRVDPPLPLHRYRARRQLVELRADDLRFTSAETAGFFTHAAGLTPAEGSRWAQAAAWSTWGYACRTLGRLDEGASAPLRR
jgi:hypothetical protein